MITTAAADTLAGLFAGAPAMGDPAVASGVAFGQVLSASADMPVAPTTPLISRTMPGIATLPICTLMGTGSLPFQASNLPAALAWSGTRVSMTTGGTMPSASQPMAISPPTLASMPIKSAPLPTVVTDGSRTGLPPASEDAERRLPVIDALSLPVAKDTPKAAISVRTAPVVEAPLSDMVTLDLPVSVPAEPEAANPTPTTDGSEASPHPTSAGKVERPTAATARLAESLTPLSLDTLTTSPGDLKSAAPSETAAPAGGKGNANRAETKEEAPEKTLVATSLDPLVMTSPAPVLAAMPSAPPGKPVIVPESDDYVSSDDDRSHSVDRNPVERSLSSSGAISLPAEIVGAPIKTVAVAAERQAGATTPSAHLAVVPPPQTDAASLAAIDTGKTAAPNAAPSTPHIGSAVPEEGRVVETGAAKAQPASFANLVTHTETTAAPARVATAPTPPPEPHVTAQPGRMGQEMGVAIARHAATGGGEAMTVRLDPVEFGRIEVTLSFDDSGTIRAVVAAESPAALDLLRRDSADLGRSLAEAGIRSDAQSFRFDTRQGSADGSGQGGQRWQQQSATGTRTAAQATDDIPEPVYRPLRTQGRVDLMA